MQRPLPDNKQHSQETNNNAPEISALLGYYAALSGSSVPTFRDKLSVLSSCVKKFLILDFLTFEDGTDRLSQNVGTELPVNAA
jgi:hypothetical protein